MSDKYILQGHVPVVEPDLIAWATWLETADRIVAADDLDGTELRVSTVFLGLDHQFGNGAPLLFETMIFGGPHDGYQQRYSTWDEAIDGHQRALELARTVGTVVPGAGVSTG